MIERKAFKKWLFITTLCGAHSLLWGLVANGNPIAMGLGILTLALGFAIVDSSPKYQAKRAKAPRLARALDGGVKFRCWLAVYIPFSAIFYGISGKIDSWVVVFLGAPYVGELFIGMGALSLTNIITGIKLGTQEPDNFIATYLTTIFTGLMHSIILVLICLIAYGVVRFRGRGNQLAVGEGATKE